MKAKKAWERLSESRRLGERSILRLADGTEIVIVVTQIEAHAHPIGPVGQQVPGPISIELRAEVLPS